jgi:hypothetical protein
MPAAASRNPEIVPKIQADRVSVATLPQPRDNGSFLVGQPAEIRISGNARQGLDPGRQPGRDATPARCTSSAAAASRRRLAAVRPIAAGRTLRHWPNRSGCRTSAAIRLSQEPVAQRLQTEIQQYFDGVLAEPTIGHGFLTDGVDNRAVVLGSAPSTRPPNGSLRRSPW